MEKKLEKEHLDKATELYQQFRYLEKAQRTIGVVLQQYLASIRPTYFEGEGAVTIDFDKGILSQAEEEGEKETANANN